MSLATPSCVQKLLIFDQLFGYISHGIVGWHVNHGLNSIFYGAWMSLVFTVFYSLQSHQ